MATPIMDPSNPLTPGVYIQELNAFPNSVVQVPTAIPVFIGYTQRASYNGQSFSNLAVEINSLNDYQAYFGGGPQSDFPVVASLSDVAATTQFTISNKPPSPLPTIPVGGQATNVTVVNNSLIQTLDLNASATNPAGQYYVTQNTGSYYLYNSIRLFYENGGGTAYIISVGNYSTSPSAADLTNGLATLANHDQPTLIVLPDALLLANADYNTIMQEALTTAQDRQSMFCVFDVWGAGYADTSAAMLNALQETFRNGVGTNALNYGAAYFPWLRTGIVQSGEITFLNLMGTGIGNYLEPTVPATIMANLVPAAQAAIRKDPTLIQPATLSAISTAHIALYTGSQNYKSIIDAATAVINVLPAAPAMAGIYTMVDNTSGVWQAPANVSIANAIAPTAILNDLMQQSFNVDALTGKSINVIRMFTGQGTLVWGARTLEGNSQDWRYINVRRTMIMIEQSVKLAARAYIFAPNDANTWASVNAMLSSFLSGLWKQGALAGAKTC